MVVIAEKYYICNMAGSDFDHCAACLPWHTEIPCLHIYIIQHFEFKKLGIIQKNEMTVWMF